MTLTYLGHKVVLYDYGFTLGGVFVVTQQEAYCSDLVDYVVKPFEAFGLGDFTLFSEVVAVIRGVDDV